MSLQHNFKTTNTTWEHWNDRLSCSRRVHVWK